MKKFFKIIGYVTAGILLSAYLAFLFILPAVVDLSKYFPQIQSLVKENFNIDLSCDELKIVTTPLLEAGIKTGKIRATLPDNSELFSADKLKGKVFLPSLLWLHVFVTEVKLDNPSVNLEIENDQQYKVVKLYENIVNEKRKNKLQNPEKYINPEKENQFDISKIGLTIPNIKLINYKAKINDLKNSHKLSFEGDKLKLGFHNFKTANIKTDLKILSDNDTNITANVDIDSFIPKFESSESEKLDDEAVFSVPFINPVKVYRDYNLKSKINSKIKIRESKNSKIPYINGYLSIEDTTVTLSGFELPKSYFELKGLGDEIKIDSNLYVTESDFINLLTDYKYGKKHNFSLSLNCAKVYLSDILKIAKAYLDTIHIKNDLANMKADGYFMSGLNFETDFEKIKSSGAFVLKNGMLSDTTENLLFDKFNSSILFENDVVNIIDTGLYVNSRPVTISGEIASDSVADLSVNADQVSLKELYNAFAPKEIKQNYIMDSGTLTLKSKISGRIRNAASLIKADLKDVKFHSYNNFLVLSNKLMHFGLGAYDGMLRARLVNNDFNFSIPTHKTKVFDQNLILDIDNDSIKINPTLIGLNNHSVIKLSGEITDYLKNPEAEIIADGGINTKDVGVYIGENFGGYFEQKGSLPLFANISLKDKKIKLVSQLISDSNNFVTPVNMQDLIGKQNIFQLNLEKNKNNLKIFKTGLYSLKNAKVLGSDLEKNISGATQVIKIKGILTNLGIDPFISLFKIYVPDMTGNFHLCKNSRFDVNGKLNIVGKISNPKVDGLINIKDIKIPEILINIKKIAIGFTSSGIDIFADDISADNSLLKIWAKTTWNDLIKDFAISNVRVFSRFIDVNRIVKVADAIIKNMPKSEVPNAKVDEIPITVKSGDIRLKRIVMDKISVEDTTAKISLFKNILYINNLKTYPMGGFVYGDAGFDLLSTELYTKVSGKNFDIEKVLSDALNMKDALSGKLNFIADVSLLTKNETEIMKSLKGYTDFNIKDGSFGPFGKFENFLMAENIRENAFFSSAIGSVITNLVTFDTAHYNELYGHLDFAGKGNVKVSPIKSQGNVMSLFIFGDMNITNNSADLKLRGKLGSAFSDSLGPLANINPVNLVKNTPGLNIAAVKAFSIFCESVSQDEMNALPQLGKGKSDQNATKFQIKLRGDTRKPLKMIKSFKWLALDSEIESAQNFVDTLPTPEPGEENLSVEELIELRKQQELEAQQARIQAEIEAKKPINRIKKFLNIKTKQGK